MNFSSVAGFDFSFLAHFGHYGFELCYGILGIAALSFALVAYRYFNESSALFYADKNIHR